MSKGYEKVQVVDFDATMMDKVIPGPGQRAITAHKPMSKVMQTFIGVLMFVTCGPALVVVNRFFLKGDGHFPLPFTLSAMGVVSTGLSARIARYSGLVQINRKSPNFWKLAGLCLCSSVSMSAGNAVYMYLNVGFIQMLKAGTPVVIMIVLRISGIEQITQRVVIPVSAMAICTMVTSLGEIDVSIIGLLLMGLSEICEGIRVVITQSILANENFSVMETLYFVQPVLGIWLLLFGFAVGEWRVIYEERLWLTFFQNPVQALLIFVLAFAVNFSSFLITKVASGLFLKLLVAARNAVLVVFAGYYYAESRTFIQTTGYLGTLVGFIWYSYVKFTEPKK